MSEPVLSLTRDDFRIDWFSGSGAGGQNRNKVKAACRVTHIASGAQSECQEERLASQNFKKAFTRLVEKPTFKVWLNKALVDHDAIERKVRAWMAPTNLRTEVQENGRWTPWSDPS
jgi:protein subunit release factor B